jgi:hypothetical protein
MAPVGRSATEKSKSVGQQCEQAAVLVKPFRKILPNYFATFFLFI